MNDEDGVDLERLIAFGSSPKSGRPKVLVQQSEDGKLHAGAVAHQVPLGRGPTRARLERLAKAVGIKRAPALIDEVQTVSETLGKTCP